MSKVNEIISLVCEEILRAEKKFPGWPSDPIHAACIVAEENGELQKAVLQWVYEGGYMAAMEEEAIQTAAMAIRFLINIDDYRQKTYVKKEKGKRQRNEKN